MEKLNNTKGLFKKGITHAGKFHADDVFSAALLRILNPEIVIERVFRVPENKSPDTIVFDIGLGKFDHHQADKEYRSDGVTPYAAFGLLWREFGKTLLDERDVEKFDEIFVQQIDWTDNTGNSNLLSSVIGAFTPCWDDDDQNMDTAFFEAVEMAEGILRREFKSLNSKRKAENLVRQAFKKSDGEIVVLEKFIPWREVLIPSTAKFVVFPSLRGGYNAQVVPVSEVDPTAKKDFPLEWRGKPTKELENFISGMNFCHPNGFLIATDTLESAIAACQAALNPTR